jgi:CBS domain-containing protein
LSEVAQSRSSEVREAMAPAELLPPETTVQAATQAMVELGVDAVAIGTDGRVEGIITDRDILIRLVAEGLDPAATLARDIMSKDIVGCGPDDQVEAAAATMELRQIRRMPVLDRDGKLIGMVGIDRPAAVGRIGVPASQVSAAAPIAAGD